jgi:hypothetical protein
MKKLIVLLLATALSAFLTTSLIAGGKPKTTPFPPHHTLIGAVNADSITVTKTGGTTGSSKTYKITKYTQITFEGKTVKVDELKTGMKVSVVEAYDGSADRITASAPPHDPSPSPSAAAAKKK